jgi:phage shock protein PspC (stress-responsive transcriptional regulator)
MNKILNINLGGYALTIDDDAYEYLQAYLENIRRRFDEKEGRDEIMSDIEARLGELIAQGMGARTIVMLPDVQAAVHVMGKPEDFGGESTETTSGTGPSSSQQSGKSGAGQSIRTGKRLFRDEDDSVVAGVCSGLSAYFGIADPVWMRLIFVLLVFLSFGFWVPAYLLLWILVPAARTAADRLSMRGEKINVDNIAREVEEGFDRFSARVNQYGTDGAGRKGGNNALNTGVTAIGQVFGFIIRFIGKFAALIAIFIAGALFLGMFGGWIASIWGLLVAAPYVDYFSPFSSGTTWLGMFNAFFLMGIPMVGLCLLFARIVFKANTPRWLGSGLLLFWLVNLACAIILTASGVRKFRHNGSISKDISLSGMNSDTLFVKGAPMAGTGDGEFRGGIFDNEGIQVDDTHLQLNGPVEVRVRESLSGQFRCTQVIRAQGYSALNAQENAGQIEYEVSMTGNTLNVPTSYRLAAGKKWRVQQVRINIEVPVGKSVIFDENIYTYSGADLDDYTDDIDRNYMSRNPNKVFTMTSKGIACASCPRLGDRDYRGDRHYENFILEGDFDTEILEGDDFNIRIEGSVEDKNAIERIESGERITLTTNGKTLGGRVKVTIITPVFTSLAAERSGEVVIRGFDEGRASISASGSSKIKAYMDVSSEFDVSLSDKSTLQITGEGDEIRANLSGECSLEASNWRARDAEVFASDNSRARVFAREDALVITTGSSQVKVDGGARVRDRRE